MKLNDIIKKLFTTFSKEVAKDVSKLQKDIVNLKPKSGATPPTSGDYIGQIFAKEDGQLRNLNFGMVLTGLMLVIPKVHQK